MSLGQRLYDLRKNDRSFSGKGGGAAWRNKADRVKMGN